MCILEGEAWRWRCRRALCLILSVLFRDAWSTVLGMGGTWKLRIRIYIIIGVDNYEAISTLYLAAFVYISKSRLVPNAVAV